MAETVDARAVMLRSRLQGRVPDEWLEVAIAQVLAEQTKIRTMAQLIEDCLTLCKEAEIARTILPPDFTPLSMQDWQAQDARRREEVQHQDETETRRLQQRARQLAEKKCEEWPRHFAQKRADYARYERIFNENVSK